MITIDDKGNRRLLFPDGSTIIDEWDKAKEILRGEKRETKCIRGYDTDRYLEIYREDVSVDLDKIFEPVYDDHQHSDEELDRLITLLETSDRLVQSNIYLSRLQEEMTFFVDSRNIRFLLRTYDLIVTLKQSTVVGVGRGSACASLVMYLLHIHDIDPVFYKIDFMELSKMSDDYA